jgi:predicted Ser/Thr protein kinase
MPAPVDPRRVEALFDVVSDLPRDEAIRLLDAECKDAPELRSAVSRLLEHDRRAPIGFLEPNADLAADALASAGGTQPSRPLEPGIRDSERVGRFLVLHRLGQGAMGTVYDAYDESLDRRVALKVLRHGLGSHESLEQEAKALARLAHPNVVQVYEIGEDADRPFVAMELVRGRTLRAWLAERPRPCAEVLRMFRQAGEGLAAAHGTGLVHRDFKPDNVLIGDDGRVRVADFGVAALAGGAGWFGDSSLVGTPAFMAPEQFLGEPATAAVDQFAFCVALYWALYGAAPFDGDADIRVLRRNVVDGAARPPPASAEVPGWVARMLMRGLARDASARFPTINALLAEIDGRFPPNHELDPNVGRRERSMLAAAMVAFGGLAIGGIWVLHGSAQGPLSMRTLVAVPATAITCLTVAAFLLRKRLLANRFSRNVAYVVWLNMASVVLHRLLALHFGESPPEVIAVDLFEVGMQQVIAAVLLQRTIAISAGLFLAGSGLATWRPEWAVEAYMGVIILASAVGAVFWARDI